MATTAPGLEVKGPAKPAEAPTLLQQLDEAEKQAVLEAYGELKKREHGELRIAIRLNRQNGHKEIVYIGVHEQRSLERLRRLYQQLTSKNGGKPVTF